MSGIQDLLLGNFSTGGYQISRSLRFNSADSAYLSRTPASASNRKTFTSSAWIKRSQANAFVGIMGAGVNADNTQTDLLGFDATNGNSLIANFGDGTYVATTAAVLRDFSSWYHVVFAIDTTQATNTNRVKIYLNGVQQTLSGTYPPQNYDSAFNTTNFHTIGSRSRSGAASNYLNGYMTEVNFIDGQALTPSSFGETNPDTGVWQPIKYTGTYGTNGFYLNFSDNSGTTSTTLGKDSSGNANNWTPNNFSVTAGAGNDSLVDTPTPYGSDTGVGGEVRGNYCTWNPLSGNTGIPTNGNLDIPGSAVYRIYGTIGMVSGKYYWEHTISSIGSGTVIGISNNPSQAASDSNRQGYYSVNGNFYNDANPSGTAYGNTYTTNDVIGVAYDADAGKLWFSKNGTWQASGDPAAGTNFAISGLTGVYWPFATTDSCAINSNFGQRPFAYTAPSGFKALCTTNLPTPTIGATSTTQANKYFDVELYTGNIPSSQSITTEFAPDFVWIKARSDAFNHALYDTIRGVRNVLISNSTNAEATETAGAGLTAFNSNGFTVGGTSASFAAVNAANNTFVAWNWNAGGSNATNTSGTITSTVRANTTAGFSIVTWTGNGSAGATVGHGLGVAPSMVFVKRRSAASNWSVSATAIGASKVLYLEQTAAATTDNGPFNSTLPSSTVITLGSSTDTNANTGTFVAYCFAAVAGYSAFGSYTGNGSADGPFVFTNHRPAFLLVKRTDSTSNWTILDFQREGYNVDNDPLYPNLSNAEGTADLADLLSNGFKLRSTDASVNANTGTYIYMSLASNPFKYALAR